MGALGTTNAKRNRILNDLSNANLHALERQ
jgi:hypothetical protein